MNNKNEKLVQTKGGFSYMESEKKALEEYLAQLAGDNKPKNASTQAKTVTIINKDVGNKFTEPATIKPNDNVYTKSFTENNVISQVKPAVKEVKTPINISSMSNSYVPNNSNSNNTNEAKNKNMIKSEIKKNNLTEIKSVVDKVPDKKEVSNPELQINKFDLISKKYDNNFKREQNIQSDIVIKQENSKVNETNANKFKSGSSTVNNFIPVDNKSIVTSNSLSTSGETSKTPVVLSSPLLVNNSISLNSQSNLSFVNNSLGPIIKNENRKEYSDIKQAPELINNNKILYNTVDEKKDSLKQPSISDSNSTSIKEKNSIESDPIIIISNNIQTEKKNSITETKLDNSNNSSIEKKNSTKETNNHINKVNLQNNLGVLAIKSSNTIKHNQTQIVKESAIEEISEVEKVIEIKEKIENSSTINMKPNTISPFKISDSISIPKTESISNVEAIKDIKSTNDINTSLNVKIENKIVSTENKKLDLEVSKNLPFITESKENKATSNANDKNNSTSNKNFNPEKRQSMLEMMNKLDLKLGGSRNSVSMESQVLNQPINSTSSGKLDMSRKIQELTKHMTGEEESKKTEILTANSTPVLLPNNIPIIPTVPSTIPSIPQVPNIPIVPPNGIITNPNSTPSVPNIPSIPGSIPPVPGIPKVPGIPSVPAIPKVPTVIPMTKKINSVSGQPDSLTNSDCTMSISEQISKGIKLKKVENKEVESKNENNNQIGEKRESKANLNMFEEMKKVQLKKVNK